MTRRDDRQDELGDARVSRAYREWSNERTPPELDRTVLNQAASRASHGRQRAWFAPLAFAATLVLGVALLFEMQSETALETSDTVTGRAPLAADRGDERRMKAPANRSESAHPSSRLNMPAPVAAPEGAPIAPPQQENPSEHASRLGETAEMKTETEVAGHRFESNSDEAQRTLQDFASAAAESASGLSQAGKRAASEPAGEVARHCTAAQTATAKTWWRCVEALRTRGDTVEADQETERLRERFPDFKPD